MSGATASKDSKVKDEIYLHMHVADLSVGLYLFQRIKKITVNYKL